MAAAPHRDKSRGWFASLAAVGLALAFSPRAHASMFEGETLDKLANILSWAVLIIAPTVAVVVFWLVHILPEKIAEKRKHPQAKAIQTLCLLSLAFGGLLWPLAWLWAYSKPVMYKMAYGTDEVEHEHGKPHAAAKNDKAPSEVEQLRAEVAKLKHQLKSASEGPSPSAGGKG